MAGGWIWTCLGARLTRWQIRDIQEGKNCVYGKPWRNAAVSKANGLWLKSRGATAIQNMIGGTVYACANPLIFRGD